MSDTPRTCEICSWPKEPCSGKSANLQEQQCSYIAQLERELSEARKDGDRLTAASATIDGLHQETLSLVRKLQLLQAQVSAAHQASREPEHIKDSANPASAADLIPGLERAAEAEDRYFPFEFEVWQGDEMVASASGPRGDAMREAMHYAEQYAQDGSVRVFEVTRTIRAEIERLRK